MNPLGTVQWTASLNKTPPLGLSPQGGRSQHGGTLCCYSYVPNATPLLYQATTTTPPPPQVRTMAAVLLRRVFLQLEYKDLIDDLQPEVLSSCQAELLMAIQTEGHASIRRKICDAVAELARSSLGERRGSGLGGVLTRHPKKMPLLAMRIGGGGEGAKFTAIFVVI